MAFKFAVLANSRNKTVCLNLILLILLSIAQLEVCLQLQQVLPTTNRNSNNILNKRNNIQLHRSSTHQQQRREPTVSSAGFDPSFVGQQQIVQEEYENLGQLEEESGKGTEIAASNEKERQQKVVPSRETDGNSQIVYVNLARVVSDKNDTARAVSTNQQLIKQDGQIACGETNRNGHPSTSSSNELPLNNRIVGGNKAEPGEFPYQVRLNIRSRRGSSLCGGVIIDQRHILTAAHCMTTW